MEKRIIINFPSNIGDTIMALPVLDRIKSSYLGSKITAIASLKTEKFLLRNSFIEKVILFDKKWPIKTKAKFALSLRGKYDLFVDLKNSLLPIIAGTKERTPVVRFFSNDLHRKDTYLSLIKEIAGKEGERSNIILTDEEKAKWEQAGIKPAIFIACASRSHIKQYDYTQLKAVVKKLTNQYPVVILGEESDRDFYKDILFLDRIIDLVGKTQMWEIFYLLKNYARAILAVDSSILHLGSHLNKPIVAMFGPTSPKKFSPWSDKHIVLRNDRVKCSPCENAACKYNIECMDIHSDKVMAAINRIVGGCSAGG